MADNKNINYMPHVDGLRAIAVIPVVLFHAGLSWCGGGYVGVDVFFVISGFLITSIIDAQITNGRFSILSFYERRARRILPALLAVMLVCVLAGSAIMLSPDLKLLSGSVSAAGLFASNLFFWKQPGGYFANEHWKSPLLHTWSLAVEEQFYLFFPLFLLTLRKFTQRKSVGISFLLVLSLGVSAWGAFTKPTGTFFLLPTRTWELMIGALVAVELPLLIAACARIPPLILSSLGASLIALPVFFYDNNTTIFPGATAVPPCFGAAMLIVSGYGRKSLIVRCLEWKPAVTVGLISYPLYLWHWPLLSFARYVQAGYYHASSAVIAIGASLVLAWLTWRFVEGPIRNRQVLASRSWLLVSCSGASLALIAVGLAGWLTNGFPARFPRELRATVAQNESAYTEWTYPMNSCYNYKVPIDKTRPIQFCRADSPTDTPQQTTVFLWGDSHVEQLYSEAKHLIEARQLAVNALFATSGGCLPLLGIERNELGFHCEEFNNAALTRASEPDVKRVVISGFWTDFFPDQDFTSRRYNFVKLAAGHRRPFADEDDIEAFFHHALLDEVLQLRAANKQVVLVMPYPTFRVSPAIYLWQRTIYGGEIDVLLTREEYLKEKGNYRELIKSVAEQTGASIVDPALFLCRSECIYRHGLVSIYKDTNHLTPRGVNRLEPMLMQLLFEQQ